MAKIRAILQLDTKWLKGSVVLEHNHELSTLEKLRYHKNKRKLKSYVKRKLEVNDRAGIRLNKNYNSLVVIMGGYDKLPVLEKKL